jgi:hypothetical protein
VSNVITAFLETLVATSGDYNAAKVGQLSFLKGVYLDVRPEVARAGQTVQVYFPDVGPWTEQAANDWNPSDINPNYVDVIFNSRPGKGILIRSFEQWQTAVDIIDKFYDPMYKRGLEYFNGQIAAQITTGNFNVNPVIQSLNAAKIGVNDATRAWNSLANQKVPLETLEDLSLFSHNDVHSNMITDSQWTQESLVGINIAQTARKSAELGVAFNFNKRWDQQAPKASAVITGTVSVNDGSASVVGVGTSFTTQAPAFTNIQFAGDPTGTYYRVQSVTDNTHLTLSANYAGYGVNLAGSAATASTYTSVAMHRYAIALAVRPLQLVNDGTTQSRIVMLNGIPFRVMISYQHLKDGYLLTMDCGCAVKVIRPDFGTIILN